MTENLTNEFGRVIYIEPNNDINGTGKGTNFTFDPEDYSILVDLQVDVVDRFTKVGGGNNIIEYTLEWDAKSTRTSMFRGTNGFLSTNVLDTTFMDIANNVNQEAIGINSIDIKYNSWNYPEITIQFTDVRGAAVFSPSDYLSSDIYIGGNKEQLSENFSSTFFRTFFMFPYPRYTLIVKGFYGRPVSYSLCVSDLKTKFNSSTGNFDMTVTFIGYMYGLFTDIPMRLLYAAPLSEYFGKEYWDNRVSSGDFVYRNKEDGTEAPMLRLSEFYDKVKIFNAKSEYDERLKKIAEEINGEKTKLEALKGTVRSKYDVFCGKSTAGNNGTAARKERIVISENAENGNVDEGSRYVFIINRSDNDENDGIRVENEGDIKIREDLLNAISEYNNTHSSELSGIDSIKTVENQSLLGTVVYSIGQDGSCCVVESALTESSRIFNNVKKSEVGDIKSFLFGDGSEDIKPIATEILKGSGGKVAVGIYNVTSFVNILNKLEEEMNNNYELLQKKYEKESEKILGDVIGFKLNLRNVVDMCLAHLDTFVSMVYKCMEEIQGQDRTFDKAQITVPETDVMATTNERVSLPPFFAFKRKKKDIYEDVWIGNDPRFQNRNVFREIELVESLINGILDDSKKEDLTPEEIGMKLVESSGAGIFGNDKFGENFSSVFVKDYYQKRNPYEKCTIENGSSTGIESLVGIFALRCLEASIYSANLKNTEKEKYFKKFGKTDADSLIKTDDFKIFKNGGVRGMFENLTEDAFIGYLTGNTGSEIIKNTLSVGNMKSPVFTEINRAGYGGGESIFYPSYGNAESGKYVVPVFYQNVSDAVSVANGIYTAGESSGKNPNTNGFGISRKNGNMEINLIDNDEYLENNSGEIIKIFDGIDTELLNLGWGLSSDWVNYFKVPIDKLWFPGIVNNDEHTLSESENKRGNLYKNEENIPYKENETDLRKFFTGSKNGYYISDKLIESGSAIKNIKSNNAIIPSIALNSGTLFQHEFYLMQNGYIPNGVEPDVSDEKFKLYRKALLFLHSLPTSEKKSFEKAVKTFIDGDSYSPVIVNLPKTTVLFLGGLYWREKVCKKNKSADVFAYSYNKNDEMYKVAGCKSYLCNQSDLPVSVTKKGGYAEIDKNIFSIDDKTKSMFIDMFKKWAETFGSIDNELVLKDSDGNVYTPDSLIEVMKEIREFDKEGKYVGREPNLKDVTYDTFIKSKFNESLFKNYCKLGTTDENSLMAMFRLDSNVVSKTICELIRSGVTVEVPFPKALLLRNVLTSTDEVKKIIVRKSDLTAAWNVFYETIKGGYTKGEEEDTDAYNNVSNATNTNLDDTKLSLYTTIKNLHDKWLISTSAEKYKFSNRNEDKQGKRRSISDNFHYINSFHEDIGDEINLNSEELPKQIESMLNSNDKANSIYSFLYDIANYARTQLLALPVFNNLSDPDYVRTMFTPMPFDKLDFSDCDTESQYVFFYPEESSKHLNLCGDQNNSDDRYKFANDSFSVVSEDGVRSSDLPETLLDESNGKKKVPVIGVTFAKQNQSFFKNISVSMDNPKTTEVSINNMILIAGKAKGGNNQITAMGQDLFTIYSNYSYECSVEMLGCACIMPLMYFQLNNLPMFKGTYIIYNVSHSIRPGTMTTQFTGQRLSRFRKKRNENNFISGAKTQGGYGNGRSSSYISSDGCCSSSGTKIKNESEYSKLAQLTGISDKSILRAVEYAETHYNGGFYSDGKLRIVYDPWIAYNIISPTPSSELCVDNQFSTNFVVPESYAENESLIEDRRLGFRGKECAEIGAFGIPAVYWQMCGASSVDDLYSKAATGFEQQCILFANLLKNNKEMIEKLKGKDWLGFAKLYKGKKGSIPGVFMPGDGPTPSRPNEKEFAKYANDLATGYWDAAEGGDCKCVESNIGVPFEYQQWVYTKPGRGEYGSEGIMDYQNGQPYNPNERESIDYANRHPLNNITAVNWLLSNITTVYKPGFSLVVDNSPSPVRKNKIIHPGYGKKQATESISLCATYVKIALWKGEYAQFSCNGGYCGPWMAEHGWKEIYRSSPNDTCGPEMDKHWEVGDVMTIDYLGDSHVGHIMIWTGKNWCSDFLQTDCKTYKNSWKRGWNNGWYHVWRYRNKTNK